MLPLSLTNLYGLLPAFVLVLGRFTGIMLAGPLFGSRVIPNRIKVGLVFTIAVMVFPIISDSLPAAVTFQMAIVGLIGELLIGVTIGLGLNLILVAAQMAGMIAGQQAGLAAAAVFNPTTEMQTTVIGEVYFYTTMIIFLLIGGHVEMIRALLDSFSTVPLLTFTVERPVVAVLTDLTMNSVVLAFRIAGPVILALLLAKAALGFLSKTMPQLHILSVGFAIFVSVGMLLSALMMGNFHGLIADSFSDALVMLRYAVGIDG